MYRCLSLLALKSRRQFQHGGMTRRDTHLGGFPPCSPTSKTPSPAPPPPPSPPPPPALLPPPLPPCPRAPSPEEPTARPLPSRPAKRALFRRPPGLAALPYCVRFAQQHVVRTVRRCVRGGGGRRSGPTTSDELPLAHAEHNTAVAYLAGRFHDGSRRLSCATLQAPALVASVGM